MKMLDSDNLKKACKQLETSLDFYRSPMSENQPEMKLQFRTAAIQGFEFTYEIAVNLIKKMVAENMLNPDKVDSMHFFDLLREAEKIGLIRNALQFREYQKMRNQTSHAYKEETAVEVFAQFGGFIEDIHALIHQIDSART